MHATLRTTWRVIATTVTTFVADKSASFAAAIAYYATLSFAPLLVLLLWVGSLLGPVGRAHVVEEARRLLGSEAGEAVAIVLENAQQPEVASLGGLLGLLTLLFSASGVFGQLQVALNHVFAVQPRPGNNVKQWLRKRLLSLGMIVAIGFLLLVSLVLSTVLGFVLPPRVDLIGEAIHGGVLLLLGTVLFASLYRVLPDLALPWRSVLPGAVVAAVLFVCGRFALGVYLANSRIAGSFGAAGSLVVLLIWMYFTSLVVLLGAELCQAIVRVRELPVRSERHARLDPGRWGGTDRTREQAAATSGPNAG